MEDKIDIVIMIAIIICVLICGEGYRRVLTAPHNDALNEINKFKYYNKINNSCDCGEKPVNPNCIHEKPVNSNCIHKKPVNPNEDKINHN